MEHRRHHVLADPDLVLEGVAQAAAFGHRGEVDRIEAGGRDVDQPKLGGRRQCGIEIHRYQDLGLGEGSNRPIVDLAMIEGHDVGGGESMP
jgi:hypothetical protein